MLKFVYLGGTTFMLPAAATIAFWLLVLSGWRVALWWSLLFLGGLCIITASKMAFLAWGVGIPAIDFKAMSGHAMLTTAIAPVGLYLLLQGISPAAKGMGAMLGLAIAVTIGVFLAVYDFHSISEIIAGGAVGAAVSIGFIRTAGQFPVQRITPQLISVGALVFGLFWYLRPGMLEHWMVVLAMRLSGIEQPFVTWGASC